MTSDSSTRPERLKTYLGQVVQRSSDAELTAAGRVQQLTKWLFDFARNVMILGVIRYIADVSGSWSVRVLDVILSGGLIAYIYSYIQVWRLSPFAFLSNERIATLLNLAVTVVLSIALFSGAQFVIFAAIKEIAKAQGSP